MLYTWIEHTYIDKRNFLGPKAFNELYSLTSRFSFVLYCIALSGSNFWRWKTVKRFLLLLMVSLPCSLRFCFPPYILILKRNNIWDRGLRIWIRSVLWSFGGFLEYASGTTMRNPESESIIFKICNETENLQISFFSFYYFFHGIDSQKH